MQAVGNRTSQIAGSNEKAEPLKEEGDAPLAERKSDASDHSSSTLGALADGGDTATPASTGGSSATTVRDVMASSAVTASFSFPDASEYKQVKRYMTLLERTLKMSEYGGFCPFIMSCDDATHTIAAKDHDDIVPGLGIEEFQAQVEIQMQIFKTQRDSNALSL